MDTSSSLHLRDVKMEAETLQVRILKPSGDKNQN